MLPGGMADVSRAMYTSQDVKAMKFADSHAMVANTGED